MCVLVKVILLLCLQTISVIIFGVAGIGIAFLAGKLGGTVLEVSSFTAREFGIFVNYLIIPHQSADCT